jgi:hypothetical protein
VNLALFCKSLRRKNFSVQVGCESGVLLGVGVFGLLSCGWWGRLLVGDFLWVLELAGSVVSCPGAEGGLVLLSVGFCRVLNVFDA